MTKAACFALLAALLAGCGGSTPSQPGIQGAHLRGVVTLNGHPVAGAIVSASRDGAPFTESASTDEAGRFCLAVPTFAEIHLVVHFDPPGQVRAETWSGSMTAASGDFGLCETAPESEIALQPNPI